MNKWLHRLTHDDDKIDKLEDKFALNTFIEIYVFWLAAVVTIGVFLYLLNMILE